MASSSLFGLFGRLKQSFSIGEGGDGRADAYPLHCFGKLPIYKDFISSGLADPGAQEFQKWLSNGFSRRWAVREEYRGAEIPAHSFLFSLPESRRSVAGSLWGSHDEGGLRRFPFAVFVVVPQGRPASDPLCALDYLETLEDRAGFIRRNFQAGRTLASFYEAHRGARTELAVKSPAQVEKLLVAEVSEVTLGEYASSFLGDDAPLTWSGFVDRLCRAVADAEEGPGAIRLPLGRALPPEVYLQFWLVWLRTRGLLRDGQVTGVLLQRSAGRARGVLFLRDLLPDDFLLLHPEHSDYDRVEEVVPPAAPPRSIEAAPVNGAAPAIEAAPVTEAAPASPAAAVPIVAGESVSHQPEGPQGAPSPSAEAARPEGWERPLAEELSRA